MSKIRNLPIKDLLSEVGQQWKNLTDSEKAAYEIKAHNAREDYKKQMDVWEKKMLIEGRDELVRKKVDIEPKKQSRVRV